MGTALETASGGNKAIPALRKDCDRPLLQVDFYQASRQGRRGRDGGNVIRVDGYEIGIGHERQVKNAGAAIFHIDDRETLEALLTECNCRDVSTAQQHVVGLTEGIQRGPPISAAFGHTGRAWPLSHAYKFQKPLRSEMKYRFPSLSHCGSSTDSCVAAGDGHRGIDTLLRRTVANLSSVPSQGMRG